jgi:anaerobic ribonucleoside-triphosphate reductase activating protein
MDDLLDALDNHDGLSLLGGDPLYPKNRSTIHSLCLQAKQRYPDKDIWLWTGYTFDDIPSEILSVVDVIIDGKYEEGNATIKAWQGSDNQKQYCKDRVLGTWSTQDGNDQTTA